MRNNLIRIIIEAGNILLSSRSRLDKKLKTDGSYVTSADVESNNYIISQLSKTKIPIISEESKLIDFKKRKVLKKYWLIDPLDGTREYINNSSEYTVNISLIENRIPIYGLIYSPENSMIYVGDVKKRKFEILRLNNGNIISVNTSSLKTHNKVLISKSHISDEINIVKKEFDDKVKLKRMGSSIKFCLVASGEYLGYVRSGPTMEWDIAAGVAICKAAGKKIKQIKSGKEVKFNKKELINPGFIVKN